MIYMTFSETVYKGIRLALNITAALALMAPIAAFAHDQHQHDAEPVQPVKVKNADAEVERARAYFTDSQLVTQDGEKVKFYSDMLDDKVVLINVMYTKCKDACPLLTKHLAMTKNHLGELFGEKVFFVSISNDPDRDSPESLVKFAKKQNAYHPGWTFLTGDKNTVNTLIYKLGLYSEDIENHNTLLLAGNTRTKHWIKLIPNMPAAAIAVKLQELAEEG